MKDTDQMKPSVFGKLSPLKTWWIGVLFPCVVVGLDCVFFGLVGFIHMQVFLWSLIAGIWICVFAVTQTPFSTRKKTLMILGSFLAMGFVAILILIIVLAPIGH